MFANVVISPDGSRIVFASFDSTGTSALWVRRFDSLNSSRIPGTEDAMYPFWAPDSRQVAFYANGFLKRVGVEGDSVRTISKVEIARGGTGMRRAPSYSRARGPAHCVLASGGGPVGTLDTTNSGGRIAGLTSARRRALLHVTARTKGMYALYVGSLRSDRRVYVGPIESAAVYSSGMLVYMTNQALEARPFDVHSLRWSGPPRPLAAMPGFGGSPGEPHASASRNGMLVYAFEAARDSRLEWIDLATGAERTLTKGPYFDPRLSPDGRRIAVERVEGSGHSNIWMVDPETGGADRWTDASGINRKAIWSPSGDTLMYLSSRSGKSQLLTCATHGPLNERVVYAPPEGPMMWPNDWGLDGTVTLDQFDQGTSYNIYELRAGAAMPVVKTAAVEDRSSLSPDGRWLAFECTRTSVSRVQLLDRRTKQLYELPTAGGIEPIWAHETGRLYFRTNSNEVCEAKPIPGRTPDQWPIRVLFRTGALEGFDVDAQGKHLLCCVKNDFGRPEEVAILVNLAAAAAKGP
jgi:Tol biopolymer transport system component